MIDILLPEVVCNTAEEFLESLSPLSRYFIKQEINAPWLFRGQGKEYPLIPSLFRKNGYIKRLTNRSLENYSELLLVERDFLTEFFRIADKRGLILPDDSQEFRIFLDRLSDDTAVSKGYPGWKMTDMSLSLMGLAQHYGLPTRLLDWTLLPHVAAFFAAEDASKQLPEWDSLKKMVVWAFFFPGFGKQALYQNDSYFIRGVTAPSATNPNLKAQQGVFTLVNPGATEEKSGVYKPFEKILESYASGSSQAEWFKKCKIQKFSLKISEAPKVLFLLAKLDITPSAIYPGYQSIISDLEHKTMFVSFKNE